MTDRRMKKWLEDYQKVRLRKDDNMHSGYRVYGMSGGTGMDASTYEIALWMQINDLKRENYNLRRRVERLGGDV
jgi:hypothetical protein